MILSSDRGTGQTSSRVAVPTVLKNRKVERTFSGERFDGFGPAGDPHPLPRRMTALSCYRGVESGMQDPGGLEEERPCSGLRSRQFEPDHHVCSAERVSRTSHWI